VKIAALNNQCNYFPGDELPFTRHLTLVMFNNGDMMKHDDLT
jgi:hypothetical protein